MDNFLEKHDLQNFIQNEIENMNGNIIIKTVNVVAENLPLEDRSWYIAAMLLCLFPDLWHPRLDCLFLATKGVLIVIIIPPPPPLPLPFFFLNVHRGGAGGFKEGK